MFCAVAFCVIWRGVRARYRVKFFCSPHLRTRQTLDGLLEAIPPERRIGNISYDQLLRELNRGYFKKSLKLVQRYDSEQTEAGQIYYQFPGGDSILEVHHRVTAFTSMLYSYILAGWLDTDDTIVVVGHHASLMMLVARFLALSEASTANKPLSNCSMMVLERHIFKDLGVVCYSASDQTQRILTSNPTGDSQERERARRSAAALQLGLSFRTPTSFRHWF